jgi:hypothetical protein
MSAPTSEENPWLSLADLLRINTSVATLATAIEQSGVQTYDRFGRRIPATDDGHEEKVRKSRALNILASYYAFILSGGGDENTDFEYDSPLEEFGWPADEAPDFDKAGTEGVPDSLRPKKPNIDAPALTRPRRTYLTVIAAMCKNRGLDPQERGTAQRIVKMTDALGAHIDDGTIQSMLKEIPEALETRRK